MYQKEQSTRVCSDQRVTLEIEKFIAVGKDEAEGIF